MNTASIDIYFFTGLGADERFFRKLALPAECHIIHVRWIEPLKRESLREYALRLSRSIDTSRRFALVGLSLGGMIVSEITDVLNPYRSIIISSAASSDEIPWYFKLAGKIRLPELIPMSLVRHPNLLTWWFAGTESTEEKDLVRNVLCNTDKNFLRWSTMAICSWKKKNRPQNLFHIHGARDHILPAQYVRPDHLISDGGHIMVYNRAEKITELICMQLGLKRV